MLTVDIGVQVANASTPDIPFDTLDVSGDVGPNHTIETVNGEFDVRLINGSLVDRQTGQQFWQAAGADIVVGFDELNNPILGSIEDTRVLFDGDSGRWFVSSVIANADGSPLAGNDVLLAVSRSSNPIDGFQSVQFAGDTTGAHFNSFATLSVDATGVFITTNNEIDPDNTSVSIYAIPKDDLTGVAPSLSNFERFENLDPAVYGRTIQFATNNSGDNTRSLGLGTFDSGSSILSGVEISNLGTTDPVTLTTTPIVVETYFAAPDGRQINDIVRINNISPDITGNVVSNNGFLWTSHSVEGSNDNAAIRWYQIDELTLEVVDSGMIENAAIDYLYPSIDVSDRGVALGFTGTGLSLAPSAFLTIGSFAFGLDASPTLEFSSPSIVSQGLSNFDNVVDGVNLFGEYSATHFDPDDPFSVFTFQQFVSGTDVVSASLTEASLIDITPTINGNEDSNEVVIQLNPANANLVQVIIDGTITDVFEREALVSDGGSITLNLGDGSDTVTIDNSNGVVFGTSTIIDVFGGGGADTLILTGLFDQFVALTGNGNGSFSSFDQVNSNFVSAGEFFGFEEIITGPGDDFIQAINATSDWIIRTGAGDDLLEVQDSSGSFDLFGGEGDDTYRLPLSNFDRLTVTDSIDAEADSLVGLGSQFDDTITINNETLTFNSNDVSIFSLFEGIEQLDFDGLDGDDTFNIQAIATDLALNGGAGNDVFNISSDAPTNDGTSSGIFGALTIDGGSGTNRLAVSNAGGVPINAIVTANQISGMTLQPITFTGNFGSAEDGTPGIILTGSNLGSDSFDIRQVLEGNSLLANGLVGDDVFTIRPGTVGTVYVDGGANADTYRTTFSANSHNVQVIDSGTDSGRDRFSIRATAGDDQIEVSDLTIEVGTNFLTWNENIENLVLDTLAGNDTVIVGSNVAPFLRIALSAGDDTGIVEGTLGISTVRFQGDAGNDQFSFEDSVASSFVQAFGGTGDDSFVVGATSFARSRVDGEAGNDNVQAFFASRDNRRINARDTGGGFDSLLVTGTLAADRVDVRNQLLSREGEFITYDENTDDFDIELIGSNDVLNIFGSSVLQFDANLGVGNDTVNVFATSTPNATVAFDVSLSTGNDTANVFRVAENAQVNLFGQSGNDNFNVGSNSDDNNGNLSTIRGDLFVQGGSDTAGIDTLQVNDFAGAAGFSYAIADNSFNPIGSISRPFSGFNLGGMEFFFVNGTDAANTFVVTPSLTSVIRVNGNGGPDTLEIIGSENREQFGSADEGFFDFAISRNVSFIDLEDIPS